MRGLIDLAIAKKNSAYYDQSFSAAGMTSSSTTQQLRLVHAYREPYYVEKDTDHFGSALSSLESKRDGIFDYVYTKRNTYGADIVVMIIDDPEDCCGMSYPARSKKDDLTISVMAWNCATGYNSFRHRVRRKTVSLV